MIPNSLLSKWIRDEEERIRFLEKSVLEEEERRSRDHVVMRQQSASTDCAILLRGYLSLESQSSEHRNELSIAKTRLNTRNHIEANYHVLDEVDAQIKMAHTRLSEVQDRRLELETAVKHSIQQEIVRWDEERRWMLRQLTTIDVATAKCEEPKAKVDVDMVALSARTNAALARARKVLNSV